jgi:hypothetical protein
MTPESVKRYPLEWPLGWKRTTYRQWPRFKRNGANINVEGASRRLEGELQKLGAVDPVLSTNVKVNMRGFPHGSEQPNDPGVAVYFRFNKRPTVLACDKYTSVAGNIAAIAAHVEALRAIDRHGVGTIEQALAGYKALPADSAADWRSVFGLKPNDTCSMKLIDSAYKVLARQYHPDVTKDDGAKMAWLNRAREYAHQELGDRS